MSCTLGEKIQNWIHDTYYKWGHFVGRKPWVVIVVSTLIALICMIRLVFPITTEVCRLPPTEGLLGHDCDVRPSPHRYAPSTSSHRRIRTASRT